MIQVQDLSPPHKSNQNNKHYKMKSTIFSGAKTSQQQSRYGTYKHPIFRIDSNTSDLFYNLNNPTYYLHSKLIIPKIKPQNRQKLKSWLLSETQNIYQRQTYATASKYLDMFFSKGFKVPKSSFQALGISCLMLASKFVERRIPNVSYEVFSKIQIMNFQMLLLRAFDFKIAPVTYVELMEAVLLLWDNFDEQNRFKDVKYLKQQKQSFRKFRIIMQTLDCMDLVPQTLDIPLDCLVISVFVVQNRRFCIQQYRKEYPSQSKAYLSQTDTDFTFAQLYQQTVQDFIKYLCSTSPAFSCSTINCKHLLYILRFSQHSPNPKIPKVYHNFRFQQGKQSYSPEVTQIGQNVLAKIYKS